MRPTEIADQLADEVRELRFGPPIAYVYHPLDYAREAHHRYLELHGRGQRQILLLGMNPGPFGMAQTGVPFGDVEKVRDWLGIRCAVGNPASEHPKRPVQGFDCPRGEVSGARIWGWAQTRFETPARFFGRFMVLNYCPLVFMESSGRNFTPDKLPPPERAPLFQACDNALRAFADYYRPAFVIGVGAFAEARAREALAAYKVRFGRILHPSPASPAANRGWAQEAEKSLLALGINLP